MTVIVGVQTNHGERAVVLGADRLHLQGEPIEQIIRYFYLENLSSLFHILHFLKSSQMGKYRLGMNRKIEISEDGTSALGHTGTANDSHRRASALLLNPKKFLSDEAFLRQMLFPLDDVPEELQQEILELYRHSFDLKQRIRHGFIPEITRIANLDIVSKKYHELPDGRTASFWSRNDHPGSSYYLFITPLGAQGATNPYLIDISWTGEISNPEYSAIGCGEKEALHYLRKKLGTRKDILGEETKTERKITIDDAVELVTGAVRYTTQRNPFCKGLEYAIVTNRGVDAFFSDEQSEYEINFQELINKRLRELKGEIELLQRAKKEYKRVPSYEA